jgi:hypothetical protein
VFRGGRRSRFPLTHVQCSPSIRVKTIASDSVITTRVSTTVLSETYACRRGLSLILVIRGGLWLDECLGGDCPTGPTSAMRLTLEPSSRMRWTAWHELPHSMSSPHPSAISFASSASSDPRAPLSSRAGARSTRSCAPGSPWPVLRVRHERRTRHKSPSVVPVWPPPHWLPP